MHQIFGGSRVADQARCERAHRYVMAIVDLAQRLEVAEPEPLDRSGLGIELGILGTRRRNRAGYHGGGHHGLR